MRSLVFGWGGKIASPLPIPLGETMCDEKRHKRVVTHPAVFVYKRVAWSIPRFTLGRSAGIRLKTPSPGKTGTYSLSPGWIAPMVRGFFSPRLGAVRHVSPEWVIAMYSEEKASQICELLSQGVSLRAACKETGMVHPTFLLWVKEHPELSDQYARAREDGYALLADELIEISDGHGNDPARDRLRVDTRKWMLSKMLPKVYGDKLDLAMSGSLRFERIESVIVDPAG